MRFIQFRSAPAQNALPAPASTTARTVSSLSRSKKTLVKFEIKTSSNALRTSGTVERHDGDQVAFFYDQVVGHGLSGDAGFEDDLGLHGIGDEAALVRFLVQLRELLRRRLRAGKRHHRPQRDAASSPAGPRRSSPARRRPRRGSARRRTSRRARGAGTRACGRSRAKRRTAAPDRRRASRARSWGCCQGAALPGKRMPWPKSIAWARE